MKAAKERAVILSEEPKKLVLLGKKVCDAFKVRFDPYSRSSGNSVLILPHPSGLNRMWQDPRSFNLAIDAMIEFYPEVTEFLDTTNEAKSQTHKGQGFL
jgi:hypothetical protein